jgi:preprotein translocase subunit SecD
LDSRQPRNGFIAGLIASAGLVIFYIVFIGFIGLIFASALTAMSPG